jgi:inorganic pyrophosphatase/exopolyphosphatase
VKSQDKLAGAIEDCQKYGDDILVERFVSGRVTIKLLLRTFKYYQLGGASPEVMPVEHQIKHSFLEE